MLGGLRARLDEDPVLVVPTFADVEHAQRELAERGAIFGARVMRFEWLFGEIAGRVGFAGRRASDFQRELIVEEAVRRVRLGVLAESAGQPGFVRAAARFFAELGQVQGEVSAARFTRALRDWAGDGPRRQYAEEVAAIYRAYREGLETAGLVDAELYGRGALDALRTAPAAWGRTPVFVYGFDDFNGLQLDALETLSRHCDVDVTVSLPYERGRLAFRAVSGVHQELLAIGGDELELPPLDDHYADESRAALHHVERRLFEDGTDEVVDPAHAVSFHSSGGERAEVELAAARVLQLLREGVTPGDVAVVFRDPTTYSSLLEQVFGAYGIPYSIDRTLPFGHTGLGRGLLALIRAAGAAGTAEDLLAYLRTPGLLTMPGFADTLEAEVRREGARGAADARARWERDRWPLEELDRLARARDMASFAAELESRLATLFAAPYRRTAHRPQRPAARGGARVRQGPGGARRAARGAGHEARRPRARAARDGAARGTRGRDAAAGPRAGVGTRRDPRAPLRGGVLLRAPGGRVPARRFARAVPLGRRPPCDRHRERARAAGARGPAGPRALPVLRVRLPGRAPARAQLPLERRGGQSADRVVLRGRRAQAARRRGRAPHALAVRGHLAAGGRTHRRGVGPRPRGHRPAPPGAAGRPAQLGAAPRGAVPPRGRCRPRARELRRLPGQVARRGPPEAPGAGAGPGGDGARLLRPRGAQLHLRAAGGGDRQPPRDPRQPPRRRAHPDRGAARQELLVPAVAEADAGTGGDAQARVRPPALPPLRGRLRFQVRARRARARLRHGRVRAGRARGRPARARPDRPRGRVRRHGARHRLQDRQARGPLQGRELGAGEPLPGRALHAGGREAARAAGGRRRLRRARQPRPAPARHGGARRRRAGRSLGRHGPAARRRSSRRSSTGRSGASARPTPRCAPASCAPAPTGATGTVAASTRRCAGASGEGADPRAAPGGRAARRLAAGEGRRRHRQDDRARRALRRRPWWRTGPRWTRCSPSRSRRRRRRR